MLISFEKPIVWFIQKGQYNIIQSQSKAKIKMQFFFIYILSALLYFAHSENKSQQKQHWIPKIIWTWWDKQISSNNHHLKIFEFNRKAIAKGWEIRHLEPSNQDKWLNQIPDNDGILHSEYFKDTWPTRRSDLVRLMVTKHFGGLYIDYTVVLTQPLDWLLDIKNQAVVQNKFGEEPDILLTYNSAWGSSERVKDENGNDVLWRPTFENSIIACKPGAEFVQRWYEKFVQIRKQSHLKYGNDCGKSTVMEVIKQQNMSVFFQTLNYWQQPISAQIVMQLKQKQFDRIWNLDKSKPRQFAVKHYKLWVMATRETSFLMQEATNWRHDITVQRMLKLNISEIKRLNTYPRYMIKFYGALRDPWNVYWLNEESIKKAKCPIQNYILEDSIIYKFVLQYYPIKFYSNPVVKDPKQMDCQKIKSANLQLQTLKLKLSIENSKNTQNSEGLLQIKQTLQKNIDLQKSYHQAKQSQMKIIKAQIQKMNKILLDNRLISENQISNIRSISNMPDVPDVPNTLKIDNKDSNLLKQQKIKQAKSSNQVTQINQKNQITYQLIILILISIVALIIIIKFKTTINQKQKLKSNEHQVSQIDGTSQIQSNR